jgi:8-oxo-dGTP diphosphatase
VAVVVDRGDVLVIMRRKDGRRYAVLPGGGVETNETPEAACLRELCEETGLHGTLGETLAVDPGPTGPAIYFRVKVDQRAIRLGDPETSRMSPENHYEPRWVPMDGLHLINLVPEFACAVLSM